MTESTEVKQKTSISIDPKVMTALRAAAAQENSSCSNLIEKALRTYLKLNETE